MINVKAKHTYADYLKTSDEERFQLLDGELVMAPAPLLYHQFILRKLLYAISGYVDEHNLGELFCSPTDVVLSETNVVQPDILFVSRQRNQILKPESVQGAPDLVVEILSPSTAELDRTTKLELYARHGVREYWIVDPEAKTIMVLLLGQNRFEVGGTYGKGHTLQSPTLEGFTVLVDELFEAFLEA
ncbi:MAG: Uma2 family endonuclease [Caldilineaceae bacterium]|nr:Uma2 family endonuclease [Caldilineaceae bacterium]